LAEFGDVVRNRRMTRAFSSEPVAPELVDQLVDLASRAPSAGNSQGFHVVVLEGDETDRYWDVTLPVDRRATFRWKRLLDAPVVMLVLADPDAYVARYAEADKEHTGLGDGADAWPVPYWTIDASMAAMTLLLAAEDAGLGALFFGVFQHERELRAELGVPDRLELVGAIALGEPLPDQSGERGRSAGRRRRPVSEVLHRGGWNG
jgi:nitroreductase